MNERDVIRLEHDPERMHFAFGSFEPALRVRPGTVVELFTEDCFGGAVRSVDDLPSQVCTFPFLNPVTGPIYVERRSWEIAWPCTSWISSRLVTWHSRRRSLTLAR